MYFFGEVLDTRSARRKRTVLAYARMTAGRIAISLGEHHVFPRRPSKFSAVSGLGFPWPRSATQGTISVDRCGSCFVAWM